MKRPTVILVLILIVLGAAAYLVLQKPGEQSTSGTLEQMLVTYDSAAVDRLEIVASSGSVTLAREAGIWMVTSPIRYRADASAVTQAVGKGRSIALQSIVSSNPQKQSLFQVDSLGTLVKVYERGTETAAFRIGKAGPNFSETYVRRESSDDVYLGEGVLSYLYNRQVKDWRDKTIFATSRDSIRAVRFQYGDTTFALTLPDSVWRVGDVPATESTVQSFLSSVSNILADEFVDSTVTALPKPSAMIELQGTQIVFYVAKDRNVYYVRTSASPQMFEIQPWRAQQLLKRKKDLAAPQS